MKHTIAFWKRDHVEDLIGTSVPLHLRHHCYDLMNTHGDGSHNSSDQSNSGKSIRDVADYLLLVFTILWHHSFTGHVQAEQILCAFHYTGKWTFGWRGWLVWWHMFQHDVVCANFIWPPEPKPPRCLIIVIAPSLQIASMTTRRGITQSYDIDIQYMMVKVVLDSNDEWTPNGQWKDNSCHLCSNGAEMVEAFKHIKTHASAYNCWWIHIIFDSTYNASAEVT